MKYNEKYITPQVHAVEGEFALRYGTFLAAKSAPAMKGLAEALISEARVGARQGVPALVGALAGGEVLWPQALLNLHRIAGTGGTASETLRQRAEMEREREVQLEEMAMKHKMEETRKKEIRAKALYNLGVKAACAFAFPLSQGGRAMLMEVFLAWSYEYQKNKEAGVTRASFADALGCPQSKRAHI